MSSTIKRDRVIILYGSYGYTGQLIANVCKSRGLHVILAGRNRESLERQSLETGYPFQVADINDTVALRELLERGIVLIHCAGPFQHTARRMVEICLLTKTHYTDISGEYQVFEMLAAYDAEAKATGICIMPGTGFDVVPSDCLALFLKNQLPTAESLQLAFTLSGGGISGGTAKTMVLGLGRGSVVRKAGKLLHIPLGEKTITVDFGPVTRTCMNIPWGDVASAWISTHIPDIEIYVAASPRAVKAARLGRHLGWLLRARWLHKALSKIIDQRIKGPGPAQRESARSLVWGRVYSSGVSRMAVIETLSGYKLTSLTSVLIAEKIIGGNVRTGFQTPASAYGPDLILEIENTRRKNL